MGQREVDDLSSRRLRRLAIGAKSRNQTRKSESSAVSKSALKKKKKKVEEHVSLPSSTDTTDSVTDEESLKDIKSDLNLVEVPKPSKGVPFAFQKKLSRLDWRTLHTIDVDRVIRDVDIDALESVLDSIAFGDIQGEDTRNFTEANFIKIFRLAQLLVEYLLHVQDLLAEHKAQLLSSRSKTEEGIQKLLLRCNNLRDSLSKARSELKQAKKTLHTYEVMLETHGKSQQPVIPQQVRHCPMCDKMFESSYYLDLHIARRHPTTTDVPEDKILAVVSKVEEANAARVKAEAAVAWQTELHHLQTASQAELHRAEAEAKLQVYHSVSSL